VKAYDGLDAWRHSFLTSALGGSEWLASGFGRFNQEERDFFIHWIGSCLGSRSSVGQGVMKYSLRDWNSSISEKCLYVCPPEEEWFKLYKSR